MSSNRVNTSTGHRSELVCTVLLIRHAHTSAVGRWLSGRRPGLGLSAEGTAQADRLGRSLSASTQLSAIYTSPLDRARETAHALARYQPVVVREDDALTEIDFGEWTGWSFDDLDRDPAWHQFNTARSSASIPGGEQPADAQRRMVSRIADLAARHIGQTIAVVSHAEPIRCALLSYQRLSLDQWDRIEVAPASISQVVVSAEGARVVTINGVAVDDVSSWARS